MICPICQQKVAHIMEDMIGPGDVKIQFKHYTCDCRSLENGYNFSYYEKEDLIDRFFLYTNNMRIWCIHRQPTQFNFKPGWTVSVKVQGKNVYTWKAIAQGSELLYPPEAYKLLLRHQDLIAFS